MIGFRPIFKNPAYLTVVFSIGYPYSDGAHRFRFFCCCQVVWQIRTLGINLFLFHISITYSVVDTLKFIKNKLIRISLFLMIVCQPRNKLMLVRNKNSSIDIIL